MNTPIQLLAAAGLALLAACSGVSTVNGPHGFMETYRDYQGFGPVAVACRHYDAQDNLIGLGCTTHTSPLTTLTGAAIGAAGIGAAGAFIGAGVRQIETDGIVESPTINLVP